MGSQAREVVAISIHALREEGDFPADPLDLRVEVFLSTPSARRATTDQVGAGAAGQISIHALREEGDGKRILTSTSGTISIHALREEGDCQ